MRSTKALFATTLFMLVLLYGVPARALDDDEVDADEYDVTARVVRTSLLKGEVSLRRSGAQDWEQATLNLPLVEGDTLMTGSDARLEIQIDARNFVRVGADSVLRIVTLREAGIALSLVQGTATLRLARFDRAKEYFEIDAPKTTLAAEQPGLYRLDVGRDGGTVRLTVREGGRARIYSETSGFTLRDGRSAELVANGADEGDWQLSSASVFDDWDNWVVERERYLAERLRYDERDRYYDQDIWGAEELDAYGQWVSARDYGWVWRPDTTVINNYYDWAPYRHGNWRWCPPYGWTWIADEPWGWAPYHYGRWVYYNNNWCWSPRGQGSRHGRNWWRPALVAFVYVPTSYGEHVAWYPLTYGQHDPYRRNRRRNDGRPTPHSGERENPRRFNPAYWRGVTSVPARQFGSWRGRHQPASADIARRAVAGEPVRARLPITPTGADQNGAANRDRATRPRDLPWRPARGGTPATLPERETGAAPRQPGVALDEALQRTRLYNGRNRRPRSPAAAAPAETGADPAERSTGAVERPARPSRPSRPVARPTLDRDDGRDEDRSYRRNNTPSPARPTRPARPERPAERPEPPSQPAPDSTVAPPAPERREGRPRPVPRTEAPQPSREAPAPPAERPERVDRPARPERPRGVEREGPAARPERERRPERHESPTSREEAPAERQEATVQRQEQQIPQPEPPRIEPSSPEPRPEPPAARAEPPAPAPELSTPIAEPPAPTAEPPAPAPEPPAPTPEAPAPRPEPPVSRPEPPAPREEAPPPAREEPAHQAETPAPAPTPPPPTPESPPPAAEPPREREAAPERPAERSSENERARTPLD